MKLTKMKIKNYRLLNNADLEVDSRITLIVGRNNTAKTSCFTCIYKVLTEDRNPFSFDDYPLSKRKNLYECINSFMDGKMSFEELGENVEPISIEFYIDYSEDDRDDNLGALSPFIIDVDEDITTAMIRVEYRLRTNEKAVRNILEPFYDADKRTKHVGDDDGDVNGVNDVKSTVRDTFQKLFEVVVYAINPKDPKDRQRKEHAELEALFPTVYIEAERRLGEDGTRKSSLTSLISTYFEMGKDELDRSSLGEEIRQLRRLVKDSDQAIQQRSNELLDKLVDDSVGFGYPNAEELQLGVMTQLGIDEQIKNKTQLMYKSAISEEMLPEPYNGLGYRNLIKIEFLLSSFAKEIEQSGCAGIPLLFIEEPESHMHPQMQQTFAKYLEEFLGQIANQKIQTFLTSHSAHIANTMEFSRIRYAQKRKTESSTKT